MKLFVVAAVILVLISAFASAAPIEGSPEIEDGSQVETFPPSKSSPPVNPRPRNNNPDGEIESKEFTVVSYRKSTICIDGVCETKKCINGNCEVTNFNLNEQSSKSG